MKRYQHIFWDLFWVGVSIIAAVYLYKSGFINIFLGWTKNIFILDSFIGGLFFTSIFTTAPAIAVLAEVAQHARSPFTVAIFGGLGAMCGDLILFHIFRDRLVPDALQIVSSPHGRLRAIFRKRFFRWFFLLAGGLVLASPLPDELGLALLGISRLKIRRLALVSFIFNAIGIFVIALIARELL